MTLYGLIGRPLGHSFSARYFNDRFGQEGIPARYELYPLRDITDFPDLISGHPQLRGLNVTIPYKVDVIGYLDSLSEEAEEIGAVNVIKVIREGGVTRLKGFNSDTYGFSESLGKVISEAGIPLPVGECKGTALVLGSGGASKAVVWSLRKMGFEPVVVGRTRRERVMAYSDLTPEAVYDAKVVVNCTPAGMSPAVDAAPPFPFQYLHAGQVCFDLIYNPEETLFMRISKAHGCVVSNGLEMLRLQAERSWEIWNS